MKKLLIENKYETEPMTVKFRKNNDANRVKNFVVKKLKNLGDSFDLNENCHHE